MAGFRIEGNTSGNVVEVDEHNNMLSVAPGFNEHGEEIGGGNGNSGALLSEVDTGEKIGYRDVLSPETDLDYRLRIAHDNSMDQELFNYSSQNTGKHYFSSTNMTANFGASGLTTNYGSTVLQDTGLTFGTFASFPVGGTQTIVCETSASFNIQPSSNTSIDFGLFLRGSSPAYVPLDGAFFRINSAGVHGVVTLGGVEHPTEAFPLALGEGSFTYVNNEFNRFLIQANNVSVTFWINNFKYAEIFTESGANSFSKSQSLPWSVRQSISGGVSSNALQASFSDYRVLVRGPQYSDRLSAVGNRINGSYQGLSGGTMGSLANYANNSNPSAAVPTNTTAALGTGLGGQFWETVSLAANTDGIICSYQVPAVTTSNSGRRLVIRGIYLSSFIQTVISGGPYISQYSLAFGHTAVSLDTAESSSLADNTTKAPRRIALPGFTQIVTANQAVSTLVSQNGEGYMFFENPIYVNPGEFVAVVTKHIGTVGSTGTVAHSVSFDYGWE